MMSIKMQFVPNTGQMLKRGRCDECKRRKKRCTGDGTVCDFCKKRGLPCNNYDALQIVQFEGPQRKKSRGNSKPVNTGVPGKSIENHDSPSLSDQQSSSGDNVGISMDYYKLTPSDLVKIVQENVPRNGGQLHSNYDGLTVGGAPTIYLPNRKLENNKSTDTGYPAPILQDETTIKIFDKETTIPKEFSLLDFLLSSTRVNLVDLATCHLEEPVSFAEIDNFLKASKTKRTVDTLKERGYLVASKTSNLRGSPSSSHAISPTTHGKSPSVTSHKPLEDIEFVIDLENLKSHYYVQKAAVEMKEEVEDESEKFANLPDFIDPVFADELFKRFCSISQEASYTSDLELTSLAAFEGTPGMAKDSVKINFLKICLPLIFGSVTVLKCVLIVSYYRWKQIDPTNEYLITREKIIKELHIGVLEELQERLTNCFSLCCDHSLFSVILLMSAEMVNGLRSSLWRKLLKLVRDMVVLRGGVSTLIENLTGLCLLKLLSVHLSVGGLFSFQTSTEFDNSLDSISLVDFFTILDSHPQLDFYDNLNYYSRLGLNDIKDIVRIYGHITQLYHLSAVSYDANNNSMPGDIALKLYGNYDSISLTNLELVLNESEMIEKEISEATKNSKWENLIIPFHHKLQSTFAQKSSLLYLYQLVYRQTSLSPRTILLVKSLVKDVEHLFEELQFLSQEECQKSVLFILPLFLLGVDLVSNEKRTWYKQELIKLYNLTRKEPVMTSVTLMEKVWEQNSGGSAFIDWKMMSLKYSMDICLCA